MKKRLLVLICVLLAVLSVYALAEDEFSAAANGDVEKGWSAFVDGDYDAAMNHWIHAAEAGDDSVLFDMGWMLWFDEDILPDPDQRAYWVGKAEEAGYYGFDEDDIERAWEIGMYCHTGYVVDMVDHEEAVYWYRRAAMGANAWSMRGLAEIYHDGESVLHDTEAAAYWYEKAAEAGDLESMYSIGRMYRSGEGVPQDEQLAVYWLMKAAEIDYEEGYSYYKKEYFGPVFTHWERAAKAGHVDAMYMLGQLYGINGKQDIDQAMYWCQMAAEAGHSDAKYMIEQMNGFVEGENPDINRAVYWCQKAAEIGYPDAMHSLGDMYYNGYYHGISVQEDLEQAIYWYKKAAEAGDVDLMLELGEMYYYGDDVEQDAEQAAYWFSKGAEAGDGGMMCCLGILYYYGEGVEQDAEQAANWFRKGADAGDKYAMHWLGEMYYYGEGVEQDLEKARMWLTLSAENHNWDAAAFLDEHF